jgi:hypothetical protein
MVSLDDMKPYHRGYMHEQVGCEGVTCQHAQRFEHDNKCKADSSRMAKLHIQRDLRVDRRGYYPRAVHALEIRLEVHSPTRRSNLPFQQVHQSMPCRRSRQEVHKTVRRYVDTSSSSCAMTLWPQTQRPSTRRSYLQQLIGCGPSAERGSARVPLHKTTYNCFHSGLAPARIYCNTARGKPG